MTFNDAIWPSIVGLVIVGTLSGMVIIFHVDATSATIVSLAIGGILGFLRPPNDKPKDPPPPVAP